MKKASLLFSLVLLFFTSCKFDQTPEGVYTGTYTNIGSGMLVNEGNGVITVTQPNDEDHVDVKFSSDGNPDLHVTNAGVTLYKYMGGRSWNSQIHHPGEFDYSLTVDYINKKVSFNYQVDSLDINLYFYADL